VSPFCQHVTRDALGWDWNRSVPWRRVPDDLKCPRCLQLMLDEDGNRWGIK
jgi:rubredoxin